MPPLMETVVGPFVNQGVGPVPYTKPGQKAAPPVILSVGLKGGTKTFSTSYSANVSFKMGSTQSEQSPNSDALQQGLVSA